MSTIREEFEFGPRKSGSGLIAEGDWYGDEIDIMTANKAAHDDALATLSDLHRNWRGWKSDLLDALDQSHGAPGNWWLEAIIAHDKGRFEIEFSAPSLFGDDIAVAAGTLKGGFDEIAVAD